MCLLQKTVYNAKGSQTKVKLVEKVAVESKIRQDIWTEELQIPDLRPTQCGVIEICYYLKVIIFPSFFNAQIIIVFFLVGNF